MGKQAWVLLGIIGVFVAIMFVRGPAGGGTGVIPAVFEPGLTLAEAQARSEQSGLPVLAFVTADWCGPCQSLKRGALSDPDVTAYLREHTIPVYLEESKSPAEIQALGPRVYPTTVLLRGGEVIGRIEGGGPPAAYLRTVRRAIADAG